MGQEPDRCGGWRTQRGDPGYMVGGDTEFPGDPVFSQFIKTATPGPDLAFASSIVVDISRALEKWSAQANIKFIREPDSRSVDLRFGFHHSARRPKG
jgi:hypothetical protein